MNKTQNLFVVTAGILSIIGGLFHLSFHFFSLWYEELAKLSVLFSNILQMLNLALSIVFLAIGYILIVNRKEVIDTKLGKSILIFLSILFFARLIMEFAFPEGNILLGIVIFIYTLVYLIPVLIKTPDN